MSASIVLVRKRMKENYVGTLISAVQLGKVAGSSISFDLKARYGMISLACFAIKVAG